MLRTVSTETAQNVATKIVKPNTIRPDNVRRRGTRILSRLAHQRAKWTRSVDHGGATRAGAPPGAALDVCIMPTSAVVGETMDLLTKRLEQSAMPLLERRTPCHVVRAEGAAGPGGGAYYR